MQTPSDPSESPAGPSADRYSRQALLPQIGPHGQAKLAQASVLLVGCGALGTISADMLVRAGVGFLRIGDRDFIEENNLQRQILFDEADLAADLPKAAAAAAKLRRINSSVVVEPVVTDVTHTNVRALAQGCNLILDGTDNFETRYLLNDLAVASNVPWIYAGVIGTTGLTMPVAPGRTACLRCVFEEAPAAEHSPSCDTAGVLAPAAHVVAAMQVVEAIKILIGALADVRPGLLQVDVWTGRVSAIAVQPRADCPCCGRREFPYLEGRMGSGATVLCGRDAVQIAPPSGAHPDLAVVARRLAGHAGNGVRQNAFLVRAALNECEITVFADGRVVIKGTTDPARARVLQAKYLGA